MVSADSNRLSHVAHGVIRVRPGDPLSLRLHVIFDQLTQVVHEHAPQRAAVEGIFFDKNAQSAAKLGHARGVVLLCLEQQGVPVREHAPARVKRTLTGHGAADKSQVAHIVSAILKLPKVPAEDASDALAIAITELRVDPKSQLANVQRSVKAHNSRKMPAHVLAAIERAKASR